MDDSILATFAQRWRLWRTARTVVRDLREGALVKVVGRAHAIGEPELGPFTGRSLAALRVWGIRTERRSREVERHLLDDVEKGHSFHVEDETGIVRVERGGFSRLFAPTFHFARPSDEVAANVERWFAQHGMHERTFFDGFRPGNDYYERAIEEGAVVAVWGSARASDEPPPPSAWGGYREVKRLFVIEPPPEHRLLVSVEPRHLRR